MNIENHVANSKNCLDLAKEKLDVGDFDQGIVELVMAYSNVRALLEHAWRLKRAKVLEEQPPGENTR